MKFNPSWCDWGAREKKATYTATLKGIIKAVVRRPSRNVECYWIWVCTVYTIATNWHQHCPIVWFQIGFKYYATFVCRRRIEAWKTSGPLTTQFSVQDENCFSRLIGKSSDKSQRKLWIESSPKREESFHRFPIKRAFTLAGNGILSIHDSHCWWP